MASFRKRDGKWQARVKQQGWGLAKTFTSKPDAVRWARGLEVRIERGERIQYRHDDSLHGVIDRYLREITPTKKNARTEGGILRRWQRDFPSLPLMGLTPPLIAKWRDERLTSGAASGTVRNALATLSAVLRHAASEWGFDALQNPVIRIRRPAPGKARTRRVLAGEVEAIKAATESSLLPAIVDLGIETAMRQGEIARLLWEHIDLKGCTAHLPDTKNGEARTVPLSLRAGEILRGMRSDVIQQLSGRVFNLTSHAIAVAFRRAVRRARGRYIEGCSQASAEPVASFLTDLRFHDLRHEAVSRLFEKGLNPMEVASVSGHKSFQMLKRYTHLKAEDLARKLG